MKVLIAPDSFKDCLTAFQVIEHIERGLLKVLPDTEIIGKAVSDGGEGLLETLVENLGGKYLKATVNDPLMRPVIARIGIIEEQRTAVIEMAQASGLELLSHQERNPLLTTSYGTGQLIKAALETDCTNIIIGIGGSATNDGGAGMAQALGAGLLDAVGNPIPKGGAALLQLHRIDLRNLDHRIQSCHIQVACDVKNPLTGNTGATVVYGPQKGATTQMVEMLDNNLKHYASVIKRDLQKEVDQIPGSGAAGGMGAGLLTFLDGELKSGFDIVSSKLDLDKIVATVDLVITAEGKIDQQTKFGKAPYGMAMIAKKYQKPVFAFAGQLGAEKEVLLELGFSDVFPISDRQMALEESIRRAPELLEKSAAEAYEKFLTSRT